MCTKSIFQTNRYSLSTQKCFRFVNTAEQYNEIVKSLRYTPSSYIEVFSFKFGMHFRII